LEFKRGRRPSPEMTGYVSFAPKINEYGFRREKERTNADSFYY